MAVGLKKVEKTGKNDRVISFGKEDFRAVEGTKKSFFNGVTKVVHVVQAEKLIAAGKAKEVKVELVEKTNENRSVKDVKK